MNKPPRSFWQIWNMSFGFLGIQFGWGLQMANMSAIYEYLGRAGRSNPNPVAGSAAYGPADPADHRTLQRSYLGAARPAASLLPGGSDPELADADPDAECLGTVDGGGDAVDTRCIHQRQHGTIPRVCGGHSARGAAHHRLRDAEPVYRPGRGDRIRVAVAADERVPHGAGRRRYARCSDHGASLVLHRRRCLYGRRAVDDIHHAGVSAGRYR